MQILLILASLTKQTSSAANAASFQEYGCCSCWCCAEWWKCCRHASRACCANIPSCTRFRGCCCVSKSTSCALSCSAQAAIWAWLVGECWHSLNCLVICWITRRGFLGGCALWNADPLRFVVSLVVVVVVVVFIDDDDAVVVVSVVAADDFTFDSKCDNSLLIRCSRLSYCCCCCCCFRLWCCCFRLVNGFGILSDGKSRCSCCCCCQWSRWFFSQYFSCTRKACMQDDEFDVQVVVVVVVESSKHAVIVVAAVVEKERQDCTINGLECNSKDLRVASWNGIVIIFDAVSCSVPLPTEGGRRTPFLAVRAVLHDDIVKKEEVILFSWHPYSISIRSGEQDLKLCCHRQTILPQQKPGRMLRQQQQPGKQPTNSADLRPTEECSHRLGKTHILVIGQ